MILAHSDGFPQPQHSTSQAFSLAKEPLLPFPSLLPLCSPGGCGPGQNNIQGPSWSKARCSPAPQPALCQDGNPGQSNPLSVLTRSFCPSQARWRGQRCPPGAPCPSGLLWGQERQVRRPQDAPEGYWGTSGTAGMLKKLRVLALGDFLPTAIPEQPGVKSSWDSFLGCVCGEPHGGVCGEQCSALGELLFG